MRALNPTTIHPPFGHYAHGIECRHMRMVTCSGQLGVDASGDVPEGCTDQARVCFGNIDAILAEAGLTRANIVRLNSYVTDRAHMADYMAARDEWLADVDVKPASTLMIVSGFTRPEFLVEVEALAVEEV